MISFVPSEIKTEQSVKKRSIFLLIMTASCNVMTASITARIFFTFLSYIFLFKARAVESRFFDRMHVSLDLLESNTVILPRFFEPLDFSKLDISNQSLPPMEEILPSISRTCGNVVTN